MTLLERRAIVLAILSAGLCASQSSRYLVPQGAYVVPRLSVEAVLIDAKKLWSAISKEVT